MTTYSEQIISFLNELDNRLSDKTPITLYLIGGGAVTLAYDPENRTADLDFIDPPDRLSEIGGKGSPLAQRYHIYVSALAEINFSVPSDWKDHCHPLDIPLKHFQIMIPCVEDIVLGKIARLEPKDFEDILGMKERGLLNPENLVDRLAQNKKELQNLSYRNNVKLVFQEIFQLKIRFAKGKVEIV